MSDYNVREFIEDMIKELGLTNLNLMGRSRKVIVGSSSIEPLQQLAAVAITIGIDNKRWSESTYSGEFRWRFGSPHSSIFDEEVSEPF